MTESLQPRDVSVGLWSLLIAEASLMVSFAAASVMTCDELRSRLPVAASIAPLIKLVRASARIKADITLRARLPNGLISVFVIW